MPEEGVLAGDVGTVVHIHGDRAGYEIEFMTLTGHPLAVVTLLPAQVRPIALRDVMCASAPQSKGGAGAPGLAP